MNLKKIISTISFILFLTQSTPAEEFIPVDKAAHFGMSFAVNTVAYAGCRTAFGEDHKTACLVTAVIVTTAIGVVKEVADGDKNSASEHKVDLLADGLGIAASTLTLKFTF